MPHLCENAEKHWWFMRTLAALCSTWKYVDKRYITWSVDLPTHISYPWQCNAPKALQWRHNESDGVSNHQPHDCLLKRLFSRRSNKTPKLRVTGLCEGNSPVTGELPTQRASNAENGSIWWRHHSTVIINGYGYGSWHSRVLFTNRDWGHRQVITPIVWMGYNYSKR